MWTRGQGNQCKPKFHMAHVDTRGNFLLNFDIKNGNIHA